MVMTALHIAREGERPHYLQEIRSFPVLLPEQELPRARWCHDQHDLVATNKLAACAMWSIKAAINRDGGSVSATRLEKVA